jgi:hypothetical protein
MVIDELCPLGPFGVGLWNISNSLLELLPGETIGSR